MIFVVDRQLNVSRDVYLQIKKMFPEIFLSLSIVFKTFCSLRRVLPSRKAAFACGRFHKTKHVDRRVLV